MTADLKIRPASPKLPEHCGIVEWFRPGEYSRVDRVLSDLKKIGARHIRTGFSWADWYSRGGEKWYEWLIPRLSAQAELLPCALYTPPSIGEERKTSSPPVRLQDYADFIDTIINRFGDHFDYIELWNEPNNLSEWDWTLDPYWTKFAEMIGGAAHWARQRGKKTVLGGMSPIDGQWLARMFELGVMNYIDVVGIHGFPEIFDYIWKGWRKNIEVVSDVLSRNGSNCQVWVTEAGFSTWQHDERKQMGRFLEFLDAPADRIYWYGVDDLDPALAAVDRFHLDEREYYFGLRKADGSPKLLLRLLEQGGLEAVRSLSARTEPRLKSARAEKGILVTGGAGFVGTNLVKRLVTDGERVILYDNLSRPGVEKNLLWLTDSFGDKLDIRIADIRNQQLLEQAIADARHVFHLSAQVAVTTSIDNPAEDFAINGCGTFSLLEAIRKAADPPSLLFTSTNKVYGGISGVSIERNQYRYEPTDPELRKYGVPEDISLDFLSPYGCSKGSADQYVLDYARTYGIAATVFRMSCIYGPHQFGTEDQGWVAHFAIRTLCNCPITLYGDGCQVRDILYVDDLVNAMVEAARIMPRISGQAFNIGGGPGRTVSLVELLQRLQDLHGSLPQIRYGEWRTGDQRYYVSDIRKFREASGWSPGCTVDDGVRNLYEWLSAMMNIPRAKSAGNLYRRQESYSPVVEAMR